MLSCRIQTYIHTTPYTLFIMFLQIADLKSSCVSDVRVNAGNSQAIVEFKSGAKYLYNNVDFSALYNLIYRQTDSIGQWVIENLSQNESVQCVKL